MKKQLLITVFSLVSLLVQAQTFVCTDMQIYSENGKSVPTNRVQKQKAKALGSKITLKFYDNSIKIINPDGGSVVLDKTYGKDDEYYATDRKRTGDFEKIVLKLNKTLGYIRSITLVKYFNGKEEFRATAKRD